MSNDIIYANKITTHLSNEAKEWNEYTGYSMNNLFSAPSLLFQNICESIKLKEDKALKARKVIFNDPATIILWEDGTKTVVKCDEHDIYDRAKGVALCYMKKALGNASREINKALRKSGAYDE